MLGSCHPNQAGCARWWRSAAGSAQAGGRDKPCARALAGLERPTRPGAPAYTSSVAGPASTSMSPMPSSSSSLSASPSTSLFAFSSASSFSASSRSSRSLTARAASLITSLPLAPSMLLPHASHASVSTSTPFCLSSVCVYSTYSGGATSFILTAHSSVLVASAARIAALMCSMPPYWKHVSSTSARIFTGCGVMRRLMFFSSASCTSGVSTSSGPLFSSSRRLKMPAPSSATMVFMASNAWP
mmetsp:Transcript_169/g.384  ORF Transcript_169/g.384 Transcript_169/m.384 type:complete len:243 (+) Transcript_169:332-1060(+)